MLEQLRLGGRAQVVREGGADKHVGRARGDVGRVGNDSEVRGLEVEEVELGRTMSVLVIAELMYQVECLGTQAWRILWSTKEIYASYLIPEGSFPEKLSLSDSNS